MNSRVRGLRFCYWLFSDGRWEVVKSGKVKYDMAEVSLSRMRRFFESGDS